MMVPTIHLNGARCDDLFTALLNAREAIRKAVEAVAETAPNDRDYYPQGPEAARRAIAEHRSRLERLQAVHEELGTIAEAIEQ